VKGFIWHPARQDLERSLLGIEGVRPAEDDVTCFMPRLLGFAYQDMEQFPEHLDRDDGLIPCQSLQEIQHRGATLAAIEALGMDEDVGVESDFHASSS
jgi:hypothetical protein